MCRVDDCSNSAAVRGMCSKHYARWIRHGDPLHVTKDMRLRSAPGTPLPERIASKLRVTPGTWPLWWLGCWEWTATTQRRGGYGRMGPNETGETLVHRVVYTLARGPIPAGLTLDHLCRNTPCCNPWHLEPVTQAENSLRGDNPFARNARKTQCPQGHPLAGPNLIVERTTGRRRCRICTQATKRRWDQKHAAESLSA